ncbi:MAG: Rieske 2Fe-2S domain-containing protein, partial [Hyphomicrobiales bacterium]
MNAEHAEKHEVSAGWVPVALSADLPDGGVMRAQIDAELPLDLVVWRSRSGQVSAFDNRCPHRGMRLSFGFVRGERLSCIYHGWQYGQDGGCRHIPAHPDMTPPASIG